MLNEHQTMISFPLLLRHMGVFFCFDTFLTTCAQTIITHHQQSPLVPLMLVSYY
jgi:hypothetical protein